MGRFDVLIDACHARTHPIVMTTVAMGAGMLPVALTGSKRLATKRQSANFYVIVNNALISEFAKTTDKTLAVIPRAHSIVIKSQTQSSVTALCNYSKLTGACFHLTSIDAQLSDFMLHPFDTGYVPPIISVMLSSLRKRCGKNRCIPLKLGLSVALDAFMTTASVVV